MPAIFLIYVITETCRLYHIFLRKRRAPQYIEVALRGKRFQHQAFSATEAPASHRFFHNALAPSFQMNRFLVRRFLLPKLSSLATPTGMQQPCYYVANHQDHSPLGTSAGVCRRNHHPTVRFCFDIDAYASLSGFTQSSNVL